MKILFNGQATDLFEVSTLTDLLAHFKYLDEDTKQANSNFVVARNQVIVPMTEIAQIVLQDGDQVDVLGAITGG